MMEAKWIIEREKLWRLHREHPEWGARKLARYTPYSLKWVKKWLRRFRETPSGEEPPVYSRSRAPHNPFRQVSQPVVTRILEIRDEPPEKLRRTPGPKAILYYLQKDNALKAADLYLPRSTRTIWQILRRHHRIETKQPRHHEEEDRPEPLTVWGIDFKDVSTVPPEPDGRKQHGVECAGVVDHGTSILLSAQVRQNYTMVSAVQAMSNALQVHGCPAAIRLDRDPRFVGSWSSDGFPSAFMRFVMCLDIELQICPPHQPHKNPFVERYHRSYNAECLRRDAPRTLEQAQAVTAVYSKHYNQERPNQAKTCGNLPPLIAFPELPQRPRLPEQVDPDRWLTKIDGQYFRRRISPTGRVQVGNHRYYISLKHKGQDCFLRVNASQQQFQVLLGDGKRFKLIDIKGLHHTVLSYEDYEELMLRQAESEWQRYRHRRLRYTRA